MAPVKRTETNDNFMGIKIEEAYRETSCSKAPQDTSETALDIASSKNMNIARG